MTITKEMLEAEGLSVGHYYSESIYILQDGTLVDGGFDCGIRSVEHREMELFSDFDRYDGDKFWEDIMLTKGLLMVIPEVEKIMIHPDYMPTEEQKKIIIKMVSCSFTVNLFK